MELTEGTVVADRFRLVQKLGQGAMGAVWKAHHTGLDISCAIKFIRPEVASSPEVRARFEREAKAAAQLKSPHVVQTLDHGVWNGQPYIAMELLEGEELQARLERLGKLPPAEVADIVQQIARALGKAHGMGLIHRDLKPTNIFLVKDGDQEVAKILDFGIAKDVAGDSHTRAGAMMGTPYYMSPEQAKSSKSIDQRADLWSLGVVVYRCLTGQLPFTAQSIGDLLMKILSAPLPVPSRVAQVPAGLDAWWARACSREPAQRFQSAKEMADALSAVLAPAPAAAPQVALPSAPTPGYEVSAPQVGGPMAMGQPSSGPQGGYPGGPQGGYPGGPQGGYPGGPQGGYPGGPQGGYPGGPQGAPAPMSVAAPPAKSNTWKIVLAVVGSLLLVGVCVKAVSKKPVQVYVECQGNPKGVLCSLTHQEGDDAAGVCWDVKVVCANRATLVGSGCQNVEPKGKTPVLIPDADFKGGKCDQPTSFSVENIKVGPVTARANSPVGTSAPVETYLLIPKTGIEIKPPPGWTARQSGDWGMLVAPSNDAMIAFIMFDSAGESTKRLGEVATLLGASGIKWAAPRPMSIGPDGFAAQVADGTCKLPAGEGEISYATVNPGVPQQVLVVAATAKSASKDVQLQAVATFQSMRKKR